MTERKEQLRFYVLLSATLGFLVAYAVCSWALVATIEDQRATCESGNRTRSSELFQREALILNAIARREDDPTNDEPQEALDRARQSKRRLIHAIPNQVHPGSVRRDCEAAYPKPPPWGWFD